MNSAHPTATAITASSKVPKASTAVLAGWKATKKAAAALQASERWGIRSATRSSRKISTLVANR
jgi:hypothetical protein